MVKYTAVAVPHGLCRSAQDEHTTACSAFTLNQTSLLVAPPFASLNARAVFSLADAGVGDGISKVSLRQLLKAKYREVIRMRPLSARHQLLKRPLACSTEDAEPGRTPNRHTERRGSWVALGSPGGGC
jgi:hypothetical protein